MSAEVTLEPTFPVSGRPGPGSAGAFVDARSRVRFVVADGRRAVLKVAHGADRSALRREGAVLRSLAGPDLVRFVWLREGDGHTELLTLHAGGPSLAALLDDPRTDPPAALRTLAATCDVVARLHALGWAHGGLRTDHVLTTPRGRIRLCSLARAAPVDLDPVTAARDRAALLRMVDRWTEPPPDSVDGLRRFHRRILARRVTGRTRRLTDDPDPLVLARILRRAAGRWHRTPARPSIRRRGKLPWFGVVAFIVATTGMAVSSVGPSGEPRRGGQPATTTTVAGTPCADIDVSTPDTDGDGCGDVTRIDGTTVVVDGTRYRIGAPGDAVAVGDWDCDGTATALTLRPSTGELFDFPEWATPGKPTTARLYDIVPGARSLRPPDGPCGAALLELRDGTTRTTGAPS